MKSLALLRLGVATPRPLNSPEVGAALCAALRQLPPELVPDRATHGDGPPRPLELEPTGRGLAPLWGPGGGLLHLRRDGEPGWVALNTECTPRANAHSVDVNLPFEELRERDQLPAALALLERLVELADASFGYAFLTAGSGDGSWREGQPRTVQLDGRALSVVPVGPLRFLNVHWLSVLGREYVAFLGRDALRSAPVYSSREDAAGRFWLQLTSHPEGCLDEDLELLRGPLVEALREPQAFHQPGIPAFRARYAAPEFDRRGIRVR